MHKFKSIAKKLIIPAAVSVMPLLSFAAVNLPTGTGLDLEKVQAIIERIANFLIVIGIVVAVIYIIWGAIRYMTSKGDEKAAAVAKSHIINGIIGAAVILGIGVILNTTAALVTRTFFGAGQ